MTATPPERGAAHALRSAAYRAFYTLPARWRRRLVRLGVGTYTVGAVVLAYDAGVAAPGRLLLVRQPAVRGWSLPAGLLRRGERPVAAAVRELAEETGIELPAQALSAATPNAVVHTRGRWIDVVFTTRVPGDVPLRPDGIEILEVAWHPVEAMPPVTTATARLLAQYGLGPYADQPEPAP